jgi:hypothetical protein
MICRRLYGGSVRDCDCRLLNGTWAECPPEARREIRNALPFPRLTGDCCQDCGSFAMVRTGTCLTCAACGSSSGGCS